MLTKDKQSKSPIITIRLLNYDSSNRDMYYKKFMLPLIKGLLTRTQLDQAKET